MTPELNSNGHHQMEGHPNPQASSLDSDAELTAVVRRMISQSSALLRQRLEHKARQEPGLYDKTRIDRTLSEFAASSEDIQDAVMTRIRARLYTHLQQEILHVLEDAVNDGTDDLQPPVWAPTWEHNLNAPPSDVRRSTPPAASLPANNSAEARGGPGLAERPSHREQTSGRGEEAAGMPSPARAPEAPVKEKETAGPPLPAPSAAPAHQSNGHHPEPVPPPEPSAPESPEQLYEGVVRLRVEANSQVRQVMHFVDALRQRPDFRLLRLVGSYNDGVGIWLGLRAPLPLQILLRQIEGVSKVEVSSGGGRDATEPLLNVRLGEAPSLN